jgi:activator of HSP90 ATPase
MIETEDIRQDIKIKATPHEIYEALIDSKKHAEFTGASAKISRKTGGSFSAYDEYSSGKNLELIPDRKIVQSWRASDWPEGHYSTVSYDLESIEGGTKIKFTQQGVPAEDAEDILEGWKDFYWKPLKKYFE